jgi:UPF0755 protein
MSLKKIGLIIVLALFFTLLATAGGAWLWWQQQLQPVQAGQTTTERFVITKGQGVAAIAKELHSEGLIRHPLVFRLFVTQTGIDQKIQAGTFVLSAGMSVSEIANQLTKGTEDTWVTIPEGLRTEEIAELFADFSEFDTQEFIQLAKGSEGYLFPDTYLFPRLVTTETVYSILKRTFEQKTAELQKQAEIEGKSFEEAVILASLIERETQSASDMKMVSGILWNRLNISMPLQVDATLQYAKGQNKMTGEWWEPPIGADKEVDSLYNTYKNPGLPPAPIANPGLNALTAALAPTTSEYIFYISDRQGKMHYSVTYEEHVQKINQYLR